MSPADLAEALFTSDLERSQQLSRGSVIAAIQASLTRLGSADGCAEMVASEYGDHPETASDRMRWALAVVHQIGSDQIEDRLQRPQVA